jgi:hypothetical protein
MGNLNINMVAGVDQYPGKVLLMAGECGTIIGPEWQKQQMRLFPRAELAVIHAAGHKLFDENPDASIAAVREYLDAHTR